MTSDEVEGSPSPLCDNVASGTRHGIGGVTRRAVRKARQPRRGSRLSMREERCTHSMYLAQPMFPVAQDRSAAPRALVYVHAGDYLFPLLSLGARLALVPLLMQPILPSMALPASRFDVRFGFEDLREPPEGSRCLLGQPKSVPRWIGGCLLDGIEGSVAP